MIKQPLHSFIRVFYGSDKRQRSGILILIILILIISVLRVTLTSENISPAIPYVATYIDFSSTEPTPFKFGNQSKALFAFDPNEVTHDQLIKLGLSERVARTFLNYRKGGAVFYKKTDVKKVFGVSDFVYKKLEPYIIIEKRSRLNRLTGKVRPVSVRHLQNEHIELNSADSSVLVALPAIGPSFARRIIKYRSLLGGYVNIEQLKEVYGFTDSMFTIVKPFVNVNTDKISKLPINTCEFKPLCKHPYVGYELCKRIFDWRKKTVITPVNFRHILDNDLLYEKLMPYLDF